MTGPIAAISFSRRSCTTPDISEPLMLARVYLSRVAEPGSLAVADLVARVGPETAAERIRSGVVSEQVERVTAARRYSCDPRADLEAADRHDIRLVLPESDDWPHFAFASLYAAEARRLDEWRNGQRAARYGGEPTVPIALWVRGPGDLVELGPRSVAIVGARAATGYGEALAAELGHDLGRQGLAVISGGAFGIDAAAHRGALAAEASTVLVAANGLDTAYPRAHAALFRNVAEAGLLISESPPGATAQRHRFLSRNRLVAALSAGTVVVEAAARSGALNTAGHCLALGRPLMAVPGPVTSAMSVGCHALLRHPTSPAVLVTGAADVLALIGPLGADHPSRVAGDEPDGRRRVLDELDPVARAVADGLPTRGWATEEELAVRSGVDVLSVLRALPVLQLAGVMEGGPDGYRSVRTSPAGRPKDNAG
ncbi:MAG: DNA-processing protein DprA [Jatrophihabitans sp.]